MLRLIGCEKHFVAKEIDRKGKVEHKKVMEHIKSLCKTLEPLSNRLTVPHSVVSCTLYLTTLSSLNLQDLAVGFFKNLVGIHGCSSLLLCFQWHCCQHPWKHALDRVEMEAKIYISSVLTSNNVSQVYVAQEARNRGTERGHSALRTCSHILLDHG